MQRDGVSKSSESNNNELRVLFADGIIRNARRRGVALPAPFLQGCKNFQEWHSLLQPCTVLWWFLLSDPAEFSVAFFQHLMHYYPRIDKAAFHVPWAL